MRAIFICRRYYPHIGGVEKHVEAISKKLKFKGHKITVITEKFSRDLKDEESVDGIKIIRLSYPKIRFVGLIYIWTWILKNSELFRKADIVHAHDVTIWYLLLRLIFPLKPFYSTFHGWEGIYPIPFKNILLRRLSVLISDKNICVGKYIEKYYGFKANKVVYGAVDTPILHSIRVKKETNSILYLGRLEDSTGILNFFRWLKVNKKYKVYFCGDGPLRNKCEKYGKVYGFVDPKPYLKKAEYCFAGGYLSALEAMSLKCKVKVGWNNQLKKDYWKMAPFYKWIKNEDIEYAYNWVKIQTWDKVADQYLELWK